MAKIKYSIEQTQELQENKYVKKCSNKNITFTKECKEKSVELWNKWLTTKEIFEELKFPKYIIKSEIPAKSLNRWRESIEKWRIESKRWRKKWHKIKTIKFEEFTDKEKIEYLQAENAYLKELHKQIYWHYP